MEKNAQIDATKTLSPDEDHQVHIERDDLWAVESVLAPLKKGMKSYPCREFNPNSYHHTDRATGVGCEDLGPQKRLPK